MADELNTTRRGFVAAAAAGAGALSLVPVAATVAADAPMAAAPAFQGSDTLKPLPFDPAKLSGCLNA